MLVEWGHHAWADVCTPRYGLAVFIVEGHGGKDTGGADLQLDVCCLVEDECEDVFVVGDGADHLDHELAVTDGRCGAGAVVCVLVLQAVVLLVHANDVLELDGLALGIGTITVEIFNVPEAVAAQGQLVCRDAESNVTNVESLLAVVGGAGICKISIRCSKRVIRGKLGAYLRREQSSRKMTGGKRYYDHHR